MIVSALLIGFFTLNFGIIGEEPPRQFATVGGDPLRNFTAEEMAYIDPQFRECKCTDGGKWCQCENRECQCDDCPPRPEWMGPAKPKSEPVQAPKRIVTKRVFAGYTYMRQCGPNGCRMVRVPMYQSVQVEE